MDRVSAPSALGKRRTERLVPLLGWLVGLGLVGAAGIWMLDPAHSPGSAEGNDFRVYYDGARGLALTGSPYGTGFVSPAPFALLLLPLSFLSVDAAATLWFGLSLLALVGLAGVALELVGAPTRAWAVLPTAGLLFFWPANNYGLVLGQSSGVVAWGLTLAVALAGSRPAAAGALLGIAALAKPHLVVPLGAWLVVDEARRVGRADLARGLLATGLGLVSITALFSPRWIEALLSEPPVSWNYWGSTVGTNVFLSAMLEDQAAGWYLWAVVAAALAVSVGVWWWRVRPEHAALGSAVVTLTLLVTPYAYPHDYVVLALPLAWLGACVWAKLGAVWMPMAIAIGVLAWLGPMPARYDNLRFVALVVPAVSLVAVLWLGRTGLAGSGVSPTGRHGRDAPSVLGK